MLRTIGERGEFRSPEQQNLWGQMRFDYKCIETQEELKWWRQFIRRHAGIESATIAEEAESPCTLHICFFEFDGIPCIVVPFYSHGRVGLVQGIVKLNRAFGETGFNGIYKPMSTCSENSLWSTSDSDSIENMGVMLLAQICKSMEIDLLFASPISFFRHMLKLFIENHNIRHWIGNGRGIMSGGDLIHVEEILEDTPTHASVVAPWFPSHKSPREISNILLLDPKLSRTIDMDFFMRYCGPMFPRWDIIHQK